MLLNRKVIILPKFRKLRKQIEALFRYDADLVALRREYRVSMKEKIKQIHADWVKNGRKGTEPTQVDDRTYRRQTAVFRVMADIPWLARAPRSSKDLLCLILFISIFLKLSEASLASQLPAAFTDVMGFNFASPARVDSGPTQDRK